MNVPARPCLALLLLGAALWGQRPVGILEVVATEDIPPNEQSTVSSVTMPRTPIFRTDKRGFPIVSWAGFVQLRQEGAGFLYAETLPRRVKIAKRLGRFDTNNWGDIEGFRQATWVVHEWRQTHPNGPPLIIGDITAANAGYLDYDKNGWSDHRTHQLGMNFNFHLPSTGTKAQDVFLGAYGAELLDIDGTRELVRLLEVAGARAMTTNLGTKLDDPSVGKNPLVLGAPVSEAEITINYMFGNARLLLCKPPRSHGDHINAYFGPE